MMITDEHEVEEVKKQTLNLQDRCDSCGAQAFVLVKLINGELLFCGHHFAKYEPKLKNLSYEIVDEREFINVKPSQSSN